MPATIEVLDNTLVHQKDTILDHINSGELPRIEEALQQLVLLRELWIKAEYHYKGRELTALIAAQLRALREDTRNWKRKARLDLIISKAELLGDRYWQAEVAWKCGTPE